MPYYRSLPAWEAELGSRLSLHRSYFDPVDTAKLVTQSRIDIRRGRLPHVSIKPPGTWEDVSSGRLDTWLRRLLGGLADVGGAVLLTIHHEPGNDAGPPGMQPEHFVGMQGRAIRMAAEEAPNVTVVPVFQTWTFDPSSAHSAPESWLVPEAQTFGLDVYNPWSPTNGKPWRSFGSRVDEVLPWIDGLPIVIGEYGCRLDPLFPSRTTAWLLEAFDYARSHNVISMSYFNSRVNSPGGSWELSAEPERTFARLLASRWVVRP